MKKFMQVSSPEELRRFAASFEPLGTETVPLTGCLGRVLAAEVTAAESLPSFRRSTMDGYAVRGADTAGASLSSPAYLKRSGEILIGREPGLDIGPGECCRVSTGGALPASADAVVMVEYTRELPGDLVEIGTPVSPGENVAQIGEDVAAGRSVLGRGTVIRPQEVAMLAGLGVVKIEVHRRVRVAILSTGDELVEPSEQPGPAGVRNVNQYSLLAHVTACGGEPRLLGIARDDREEIAARVREGLATADVVLISGGSSVGTRDFTSAIIDGLGEPGVRFQGVAVRPGKPTIVGQVGDAVIFGLPGHPISAMVSFLNFVRPVLLRLGGVTDLREQTVPARLADNVHSKPGREDYVQVALAAGNDGRLEAVPIFRKSGMVTSMVGADGLIVIPMETEGLEVGDEVQVLLYPRVLR